MKIKLVYRDEDLGVAWKKCFSYHNTVSIIEGDICNIECDAIVSPANSFGFMDGGLDYALSEKFGWDLQKRLQKIIGKRPVQELLVGEALIISTGSKDIPWLISAPTMRVPMQVKRSVNPYLAMKAILSEVLLHKELPEIETIAVPGLGTGVGGILPEVAAMQMFQAYKEIILKESKYPEDFAEAKFKFRDMNPGVIFYEE